MMKSDFPSVTLTAVKRQGEQSGIHKFATAVRNENEDIKLDKFSDESDLDCLDQLIRTNPKPSMVLIKSNQTSF